MVPPHDSTAHYEDLRRLVIEASGRLPRGPGISVFLRYGLAAWMQAWPEEAACCFAPSPTPRTGDLARLPAGIYEEVTHLLVEMIFHRRQEILT